MNNKFVTEQNKKIFDEYDRTGIRPTHLFCYKCSQKKSIEMMVKNSNVRLGVISLCSECNKENVKQYKEKNREAINQKARDKHATPEYKEQSWKEYLAKLPEPLRKNKIIKKECEETGKIPTHKHCNKCGELLPLDSYSVSRSPDAIFGHDSICKVCQKKKRDNTTNESVVVGKVMKHNIKVNDENNALDKFYKESGIQPTHKFCNTCEQKIDINNFHVNVKQLFGRVSRCKDCEKKHKTDYYLRKKNSNN